LLQLSCYAFNVANYPTPLGLHSETWTTRSHGAQADLLVRKRAGLDLAFLATASAVFFRLCLRAQVQEPDLLASDPTLRAIDSTLRGDVQSFLASLARIQLNLDSTAAALPHADLLQVEMWRAVSHDRPAIERLSTLSPLLEKALLGTAQPGDLAFTAHLLDKFADSLQAYRGDAPPAIANDLTLEV
jgi:hypothetical protein